MSLHSKSDTSSDHPSRQLTTDQLTAVTHFLDEIDAKTPIKHMQKENDGNKTLLDTINALIAVGAFIAGVQAQVISVTNNFDPTFLNKTTNWFGFVGLTLDLIGTIAGVIRALLLQQAIRRSHRLSVRLAGQIDGARHEVREQQQRMRGRPALAHTPTLDPRARAFLTDSMRAISRVMAIFAEDGRFGVQASAAEGGGVATGAQPLAPPIDLDAAARHRHPRRGKGGVHPLRWWMRGFLLHVDGEGIGHVPVVSLAGGGVCLLVSVVLYAAASQPRVVWVTCASITAGTLVWTLIPTTNPQQRNRATLYDHVEETLEQCPPVDPPVFPAVHGGV